MTSQTRPRHLEIQHWIEAEPFRHAMQTKAQAEVLSPGRCMRPFIASFSATLCLGSLVFADIAPALELAFLDGDLLINVANTMQWGISQSTEAAAENLVGRQNGGSAAVPMHDDGRVAYNFGDDVIANQVKVKTTVDATLGPVTARARVLGFYDFDFMDHQRNVHPGTGERIEYTDDVKDQLGRDIRFQELHVGWETFIGDHPLTLRTGDQVLNWGQSTLLMGLNMTNPLNVNRILSPTFELDEVYNPVNTTLFSFGITENLAIDAYYQWEFKPFELPPGGSFFSMLDITGAGVNDSGQGYICIGGPVDGRGDNDGRGPGNDGGWCGPLDPAHYPKPGEWGVKLGYTAEWLNYTEFGFYYQKMNMKAPTFNAIAGVIPNAGCPLPPPFTDPNDDPTPCPTPDPDHYARVFLAYPDGIETYGFSWSTSLPFGGLAWAGEVSVMNNYPVQIGLPELVSAAGYIDPDGSGPLPPDSVRNSPPINPYPAQNLPEGLPAAGIGEAVQGYDRLDVARAHFTLTRLWPNALGGDTLITLLEVGYHKVLRMPGGVGFYAEDFGDPSPADDAGWGYRLILMNEYTNVLGTSWTLKPTLVLSHDVKGLMPGNTVSFVEGSRMAVGVIEAEHPSGVFMNVKYQAFWGAGKKSVFQDMDNAAFTIGMRF